MGEIKATIQFKRATSSKWAQLNPILAKGEPGYETDTGKLKIGDGTSTWQSLKYLITEELDPTVPEWAKQENKPTYTASEVGAYNKSEVDTKLNSKANSSHTHTSANISDLKNQVPKNATRVSSGYDLNNYNSSTHCGYYYAGGSNNCLSKPSGVDAFGLQIVKNADGYIMQILYASNNSKNDIYSRVYGGGAWTGWEKLAQSGDLTWANLSGKPSTFTPSSHTHTSANITDLASKLEDLEQELKVYTTQAVVNRSHSGHRHTVIESYDLMSGDDITIPYDRVYKQRQILNIYIGWNQEITQSDIEFAGVTFNIASGIAKTYCGYLKIFTVENTAYFSYLDNNNNGYLGYCDDTINIALTGNSSTRLDIFVIRSNMDEGDV